MKTNKRTTLLGLTVLLAAVLLLSLSTFLVQAATQIEPTSNEGGTNALLQTNGFEVTNDIDIAINKTPNVQWIQPGDTANFTVTITNTGTVALGNIVVTDALVPDCNFTMSSMNPGSGSSRTCSKSNVTEDFTNSVTVNAEALDDPDMKITKSAEAAVRVFTTRIFLPLVTK